MWKEILLPFLSRDKEERKRERKEGKSWASQQQRVLQMWTLEGNIAIHQKSSSGKKEGPKIEIFVGSSNFFSMILLSVWWLREGEGEKHFSCCCSQINFGTLPAHSIACAWRNLPKKLRLVTEGAAKQANSAAFFPFKLFSLSSSFWIGYGK